MSGVRFRDFRLATYEEYRATWDALAQFVDNNDVDETSTREERARHMAACKVLTRLDELMMATAE